jgi:hypothetical protein
MIVWIVVIKRLKIIPKMKSPSKYGKKLTTIYYNNNIFISFFHLFSTPNLLQGWREPLPLGDTRADLRGQ